MGQSLKNLKCQSVDYLKDPYSQVHNIFKFNNKHLFIRFILTCPTPLYTTPRKILPEGYLGTMSLFSITITSILC